MISKNVVFMVFNMCEKVGKLNSLNLVPLNVNLQNCKNLQNLPYAKSNFLARPSPANSSGSFSFFFLGYRPVSSQPISAHSRAPATISRFPVLQPVQTTEHPLPWLKWFAVLHVLWPSKQTYVLLPAQISRSRQELSSPSGFSM